MNSESDWSQAAQQFQQNLGESWSRALQSMQALNSGALPTMPQLSFSPEKLQALQQAYLNETVTGTAIGSHAL